MEDDIDYFVLTDKGLPEGPPGLESSKLEQKKRARHAADEPHEARNVRRRVGNIATPNDDGDGGRNNTVAWKNDVLLCGEEEDSTEMMVQEEETSHGCPSDQKALLGGEDGGVSGGGEGLVAIVSSPSVVAENSKEGTSVVVPPRVGMSVEVTDSVATAIASPSTATPVTPGHDENVVSPSTIATPSATMPVTPRHDEHAVPSTIATPSVTTPVIPEHEEHAVPPSTIATPSAATPVTPGYDEHTVPEPSTIATHSAAPTTTTTTADGHDEQHEAARKPMTVPIEVSTMQEQRGRAGGNGDRPSADSPPSPAGKVDEVAKLQQTCASDSEEEEYQEQVVKSPPRPREACAHAGSRGRVLSWKEVLTIDLALWCFRYYAPRDAHGDDGCGYHGVTFDHATQV